MLSTMEKILFLLHVSTFQSMSSDQLRVISSICTEEEYEKNAMVFHQGDPGDKMYIIISGKIAILDESTGEEILIVELGENTVLGEMATITDSLRSAGSKALTPIRLLAIEKEKFQEIIREYPELSFEIFKELSRKIRKSNDDFQELKRQYDTKISELSIS